MGRILVNAAVLDWLFVKFYEGDCEKFKRVLAWYEESKTKIADKIR